MRFGRSSERFFLSAAAAAMLWVSPSVAFAQVPPVAHQQSEVEGDAFFWQEAPVLDPGRGSVEGSLIVVNPGQDGDSATFRRFVADGLAHQGLSQSIGSTDIGLTIESVAAAARWDSTNGLVADPANNLVWRFSTGVAAGPLIPFTALYGDGGGVCSPVGLTTWQDGVLDKNAFIAEGSLDSAEDNWEEFLSDCGTDATGGILTADGLVGSPSTLIPAGSGSLHVPFGPTQGLAIDSMGADPELLSVGGIPVADGFPSARLIRWHLGSGSPEADNWPIPPEFILADDDWPGIGQPSMVAALKDDRVAIAGSRGILLFTDSGNALETVFVAGYLAQPETEDAVAVLDMGADPEGESLFALMETSDGGRALVAWDADDLAALTGAQICVDHKADVPAGECNPLDAGECVAMCSTIQAGIDNAPTGATIHVAPGEYHENLVVGYRAMDLIATEPGSVHVVADRPEPVLSAYYNGEPGLLVDGFVFEGGRGLSIPELGPGTTFGGGVAMVWAAVTLKRTAVMDNQATGGGGVAAVLSRRLTLLNVGLLGNDADYGGGLAVLGAGIYHYLITPPFD